MDPENQETSSSWATRRKAVYLAIAIILFSAAAFGIFWKFWYVAPTCFDKVKNGDETGVDCGGSCTLICQSDVLKPVVKWDPRLFEVFPDLWSALVYVENPNLDADATYVPYTLSIYGSDNQLLEERKGATILPKNKTVGIFEGNIVAGSNKPKRAIFEIESGIIWKKSSDLEEKIAVTHSPILKLESEPRIEATVKNNSTEDLQNIELVAAIFDGADNAVATSRTFVENLPKNGSSEIFFTWPRPFALGVKVCEKPSDVMLLLDRSGSMAALGKNPPQPLSDAKAAAASFIEELGSKDRVGMVSFASTVRDPIDLMLSNNFEAVKEAAQSVAIATSSTQYTNVYDPLRAAWGELISARAQEKSSKIVILLTDGVANNPKDPQGRTEAQDIKYAESLALKEAADMKNGGIVIYTIGLGNQINESFLKTVASEPGNYFFAPTASDLESIYQSISSDICKEMPARIEINYKIFGSSI